MFLLKTTLAENDFLEEYPISNIVQVSQALASVNDIFQLKKVEFSESNDAFLEIQIRKQGKENCLLTIRESVYSRATETNSKEDLISILEMFYLNKYKLKDSFGFTPLPDSFSSDETQVESESEDETPEENTAPEEFYEVEEIPESDHSEQVINDVENLENNSGGWSYADYKRNKSKPHDGGYIPSESSGSGIGFWHWVKYIVLLGTAVRACAFCNDTGVNHDDDFKRNLVKGKITHVFRKSNPSFPKLITFSYEYIYDNKEYRKTGFVDTLKQPVTKGQVVNIEITTSKYMDNHHFANLRWVKVRE